MKKAETSEINSEIENEERRAALRAIAKHGGLKLGGTAILLSASMGARPAAASGGANNNVDCSSNPNASHCR